MRKKKMRRGLSLVLAVLIAGVCLLSGCGAKKRAAQEDAETIQVYLWNTTLYENYAPYIQSQLPDVNIEFIVGNIVGNNDLDFYRFLNENGGLPDIITCCRFSLNDAAPLAEYLMDLSTTEVAGTFYSSYLNNNQEPDGAIRWLPMCAEVDGTAANVDLFAQYNIPLPTNYAEFVAAIDAFEAVGIKGYQADWRYDYTCLETMQGCAIPELMSLEGTTWRMNYESETEDGSTTWQLDVAAYQPKHPHMKIER